MALVQLTDGQLLNLTLINSHRRTHGKSPITEKDASRLPQLREALTQLGYATNAITNCRGSAHCKLVNWMKWYTLLLSFDVIPGVGFDVAPVQAGPLAPPAPTESVGADDDEKFAGF